MLRTRNKGHQFATASDTFDIDDLIHSLDARRANSAISRAPSFLTAADMVNGGRVVGNLLF